MTELSRTSALASRHTELGSGLEDWNDMGTAWSYNTDPNDEHDAVREAAGMFDMSPLKKVMVRGKDAARVVNHTLSRNIESLAPGQSAYSAVLTDQGTVCDDAIAGNNGNNEWMFCHGSGESMQRLQESAKELDASLELDDSLHDISLQGPKSLSILDPHTPANLSEIAYFQHIQTTLFGHNCRISRTGYSGERGYEIFADGSIVGEIWDEILHHGKQHGVMPCSFGALDKVRIEAGLLFFGYDMTADHSPWEVGLGFTVSRKKNEFRGKDSAFSLRGKERFLQTGIMMDHPEALIGGEQIQVDGKDIGTLNSPAYSHRLQKSLALAHVHPQHNTPGTKIEVVGESQTIQGIIAELPFYDAQKLKTHA